VKRRSGGFTLIELIASVVLASMMMAALMNIVWSVLREMNRMQVAEANRFPVTILSDQLRQDFINSRGILADANGVTLHGYLDREAESDQTSMLAGRVRYEIVASNRSRRLVRRTVSRSGARAEPVWYGAGSLSFESLEESQPGDLLLGDETGGLPPAPGRFRVTMTGADGQILWREVIHHHAG
jgi:hypothetical protein